MRRHRLLVPVVVLLLLVALPVSVAGQRSRVSEADVSVSSVTASDVVATSQPVTVEAVIENPGARAASVNVNLSVTPDGSTQSQTISVNGESSLTVSFTWTVDSPGDYASTVTAGYASDPDPNNNSGSASTTVLASDNTILTVESLTVGQVDDPTSIQITADVSVLAEPLPSSGRSRRNARPEPAGNTEVEVTFTGPRGVETVATGTTDANGQATITATITDHPHGMAPWIYRAKVTSLSRENSLYTPADDTSEPQELMVRAQEQFVYATDENLTSNLGGIYKLDPAGTVLTSANAGTGYRYTTTGMDGNVYAINWNAVTVDVFDPDLNSIASYPIPDGTDGVSGVAVDRDGNIYVTDRNLDRVILLNPDGTPRTEQWSGGQISGTPLGIAVDRDGRIYVGEYGNSQVRVFDQAGNLLNTISHPAITGGVLAVTLDGMGNLYASDDGSQGVHVFTEDGAYQRSFGSGALAFPVQTAVSAWANDVYVTDYNDQIEIFDGSGSPQGEIDYGDPSDNVGVTLGY